MHSSSIGDSSSGGEGRRRAPRAWGQLGVRGPGQSADGDLKDQRRDVIGLLRSRDAVEELPLKEPPTSTETGHKPVEEVDLIDLGRRTSLQNDFHYTDTTQTLEPHPRIKN